MVSNPTHDHTAKKMPTPGARPLNALTGSIGATGTPPGPPPCANTATTMTVSTTISKISATPSTFELSRTSKCPRTRITTSAPKPR